MASRSPSDAPADEHILHKAVAHGELPEGRVTAVTCGGTTVAITHFGGEYAALDNLCPHKGGPFGEGSIEQGLLRCRWHGWYFNPLPGETPGEFDDGAATYPVEERQERIYGGFPPDGDRERTVSDLIVETLFNWDLKHGWGIVGHSNLGLADALRAHAQRGNLSYCGIRHEGAGAFAASAYGKLTGRSARFRRHETRRPRYEPLLRP